MFYDRQEAGRKLAEAYENWYDVSDEEVIEVLKPFCSSCSL